MSLIATSKLTVIIGLGVTGLSAARFLHQKNIRFLMMDSRENPPGLETFKAEFPDVVCILGCLDEDVLSSAEEIVISPGMSLKTPELQKAIEQDISVIGDIELFARYVDKPVIAITGSNAKSTVTTLVGEMAEACGLRVAVGGNLGVPVLELIYETAVDLFVLELSSFQLETTYSLKPQVATVLNISEDHMDRYDSLMEYYRAKQRIYHNANHLVINRQDPLTHPPLGNDRQVWSFGNDMSDRYGFGLKEENNQWFLCFEFSSLLNVNEMLIKGKHNYLNALSALAIGKAAGFEVEGMLLALKSFKGLPHRCEYIDTIKNVTYINDSKATNVGATLAALEGFGEELANIYLIAGGESKGADFSPLKPVVEKAVKAVILIGVDAELIEQSLSDRTIYYRVTSMSEAVSTAADHAQAGDIVLLSPACASFDMFAGFEDRGNSFKQSVLELAA